MEYKSIKEELCSHIIGDLADVVLSYFDREVRIHSQWGRAGSGEGEFKRPTCICRLPSGEFAVVDSWNNRIQVLSPEGKFLRQWGRAGRGEGEFHSPHQMVVLPSPSGEEEIFVVDSGNNRIQVFTPEGKFLRQWGKKGELDYPRGISLLPGGRVIVFDADSPSQIQIYRSAVEGKFLSRWDNRDPMHQLSHISGMTTLPNGKIVIADDCGRRIQVFTEGGEFLRLVEKTPTFSGSRIQVFSLDGVHLWQWGDHDTPGWWLYSPQEVAHLSNHRVAIPDPNKHQITIYGVHLV